MAVQWVGRRLGCRTVGKRSEPPHRPTPALLDLTEYEQWLVRAGVVQDTDTVVIPRLPPDRWSLPVEDMPRISPYMMPDRMGW